MIYIHVPFCRHKCSYCDFVSGTNIGLKDRYLSAVETEMDLRMCAGEVETLYFGGGTPSMLDVADIVKLRKMVEARFDVSGLVEWTVECNPEDMSEEFLCGLLAAGVTRLSVGVQSLDDEELRWMERRHNGEDALKAVLRAQNLGFDNISCDVIFGVPGNGLDKTLDGILALGVQHISAYSLMMEEGSKITKKKINGVCEEVSNQMYRKIVERLRNENFIHYEISNWALDGFVSRHNSGYWNGNAYLGFGPAAHSFDGSTERRWNIGNTLKYCSMVEKNELFWESETLSESDRFNEMVMLGLRKREGIDLIMMEELFGSERRDKFVRSMKKFERFVTLDNRRCALTEDGVFVSDMIMTEGFI